MRHLSSRRRAALLAGMGVAILCALLPVMLHGSAATPTSRVDFGAGFVLGLAAVALAAAAVVRLRRR